MLFLNTSLSLAAIAISLSSTSALSLPRNKASECRCFPGDDCWPSESTWTALNETVDGGLIATVPLAAVCYDHANTSSSSAWPAYDEEACASLRDNWLDPDLHYPDTASIMAPYFANQSCDPFQQRNGSCATGTYVQYTINVTCASDITAGIEFARKHNIRLVIRNTRHDFNGKSTGAGGLGIWMSHLKDIEIKDWSDKHYTGKAMKMGAGVQGMEANKAAYDEGLQVVTGECPSVGIAGGYSQGGGHSVLTSRHGLAADQVLEWEVITTSGEHLIASREENTDLYWALSGGGGGTYAIVLSMTSKAHVDEPAAGANLTFSSQGISQDTYYSIIDTWQQSLPAAVDAGAMIFYSFSNETFAIVPMMGPGLTSEQLQGFLRPLTSRLEELNITYNSYVGSFDSYTESFSAMFPPVMIGLSYATRLTPQDVMLNNGPALVSSYRDINAIGGQVTSVAINASLATAGFPENSVHPAWRDALALTFVTQFWDMEAPWEVNIDNLDFLTHMVTPKLDELIPDGATYLNEADFRDPNWKHTFYGENYEKLEAIKDKYDPEHMFYGPTAVGSDYWEEQADGRLCKAKK